MHSQVHEFASADFVSFIVYLADFQCSFMHLAVAELREVKLGMAKYVTSISHNFQRANLFVKDDFSICFGTTEEQRTDRECALPLNTAIDYFDHAC
jgi:hypothetical protein